jgi:acyl phosphate:glycerol-3-phosphate acyltransferase
VLAGYLAGSLPFGYWLVRAGKGTDIRTLGSGNIGGTNVWRVYGAGYGAPTIVLDAAKGFGPAFLAAWLVDPLAGVLAGAGAMVGHWRPLFLGFAKGGKMVATAGGVFAALAPLAVAVAAAAWLLAFVATRYVSLASMAAALVLPAAVWLLGGPWPVVTFAAAAAVGVLLLHRANIARLRAGTENRASLRRRGRDGDAAARA